jgi:hypothetical protein
MYLLQYFASNKMGYPLGMQAKDRKLLGLFQSTIPWFTWIGAVDPAPPEQKPNPVSVPHFPASVEVRREVEETWALF